MSSARVIKPSIVVVFRPLADRPSIRSEQVRVFLADPKIAWLLAEHGLDATTTEVRDTFTETPVSTVTALVN